MHTISKIIQKKRDKKILNSEEIQFFIQQFQNNKINDAQLAAFFMAIYLNDLNQEENLALTLALRDSTPVIKWDLNAPVVDRQTNGGVGDLVSIVFTPLLAACGAYVPMVVGRNMKHTGGTLEKLSSIPGFKPHNNLEELKRIVKNVGCAIIGQYDSEKSALFSPLTAHFDEIREQSGTVESEALMASTMLSRKLSMGLDALVFDIKVGNGSLSSDYPSALRLAQTLIYQSNSAHCHSSAVLSDMNQVLASSAGFSLEIAEAVRFLRGEKVNLRLQEVIFNVVTEALLCTKLANSTEDARQKIQQALSSGKAAERFDHMIIAQGGPDDFCNTYKSQLRKAEVIKPLFIEEEGILQMMNTYAIGEAVMKLSKQENGMDYSVGFSNIQPLGAYLQADIPAVTIHAANEEDWQKAAEIYKKALTIGENPPADQSPIYKIIRDDELQS